MRAIEAKEIRQLIQEGATAESLAKEFAISESFAASICNVVAAGKVSDSEFIALS